MKQTILILSIFLFLTSCQTSGTQTETNLQTQNDTLSNQHTEIKSIINGSWYELNYIDDIRQTKSPFKSQNALTSIVEIDIDTTKAIGDTLEVGAPSIHEGYSFRIVFKTGLTKNSVQDRHY